MREGRRGEGGREVEKNILLNKSNKKDVSYFRGPPPSQFNLITS